MHGISLRQFGDELLSDCPKLYIPYYNTCNTEELLFTCSESPCYDSPDYDLPDYDNCPSKRKIKLYNKFTDTLITREYGGLNKIQNMKDGTEM